MASSSGTSSASTLMQNSGSETDLLGERKRKRMLSNRESARRSRMRKQKQLDNLMAQVNQLRNENNHIIHSINSTTQHYLNVEAENSELRVQHEELTYRLQSQNQIISFLNSTKAAPFGLEKPSYNYAINDNFDELLNPWNVPYSNQQQPIMASAETFNQY